MVIGLAPPLLLGVTAACTPGLLGHRLPQAVHDAAGLPAESSWTLVGSLLAMWILAMLAIGTFQLLWFTDPASRQRSTVALMWGGSTLCGGWAAAVVLANLDVGAGPARPGPWWSATPWWLVLVLAAGALGWLASGPDPAPPLATTPPGPDAPRMPLADGERVLWTRSLVSRPALGLAVLWLAGAAYMGWADVGPGLLTAVLYGGVAVLAVTRSWARVRVDSAGVHVEQPLLRRALVGAGIDEIVEASPRTVRPERLSWSDYGVLRQRGLIGYRATRSGEALHLDLAGGREFLVTVPDARTAASLVNTELDRRRTGDPLC